MSRGTLDEKLEWTFQLYDVNGDGFISKEEMTEVMTSVYELMGKVSEGCKEENQIKAKVENMFKVTSCFLSFTIISASPPRILNESSFLTVSLFLLAPKMSFQKMDLNADDKISLEEFLTSCHKNDGLMQSVGVFQTVF